MKKEDQNPKNNKKTTRPDPGILGTTDPQEHMTGPVSSLMQKVRKGAASRDEEPDEVEKHEHKRKASGGDFINK